MKHKVKLMSFYLPNYDAYDVCLDAQSMPLDIFKYSFTQKNPIISKVKFNCHLIHFKDQMKYFLVKKNNKSIEKVNCINK